MTAADDAVWAVTRDLAGWLAGHPLTALAACAATVAGHAAATNLLAAWRHRRHATGARLVTIAPPPQVEPGAAAALWANLHGVLTPSRLTRALYGAPHVAVEYTWTGRRLQVRIWVPGTVPPGAVEAAVRAAWPGASCTTTAPHETPPAPIPTQAVAVAGGQLSLSAPDWLPYRSDHDTDPLRALTAAAAGLRDSEHACVQVLTRPATPRRTARARRVAGRMRAGKPAVPAVNPATPLLWAVEALQPGSARRDSRPDMPGRRDPATDRNLRAALDKTSHPLWETAVRYAVAATDTRRGSSDALPRLRGIAHRVAAAFSVHDGRNQLTRRRRLLSPAATLAVRRLGGGFLTSTPELAAIAALPQDLAVPGLERAQAKSMPAPVTVPAGGRGVKILGDATVGGHPVGLSVADARYHTHMIGATGSGKTSLLANLIVADAKAGRGVVAIEPHGDLILDVLDRLPARLAHRVVLLDPDQPNPPTLNPLEGNDHDLVVDNLVSIFSKIFVKAWGPRMDDVMRVACLTLLRHDNVTLHHVPALLTSKQVRAEMTVDLDDPDGLGGFWQWYDELSPVLRSQVIGPVLARLRAFLLRDFVRKTMRQPKSSIDMTKILDGGILLVRLPKGVLGEDTVKLLGSLILAQVWQAATARARTPIDQRRDCAIYIDECVRQEAL